MSSSSEDTSVMSLEDFVDFLLIPYEEIESATNNFAVENLLTQGSSFKVYRGQLLQQSGDLINIVARISLRSIAVVSPFIITRWCFSPEADHPFCCSCLLSSDSIPSSIIVAAAGFSTFAPLEFRCLEHPNTHAVVESTLPANHLKGLPSIVRQHFNEGTLNNLVDPKLVEADENILNLIGGVDQDSLDTFTKIGYQCLAETQTERPTMEVIIQELEKALNFQAEHVEDNACDSLGYVDPEYQHDRYLTQDSDVYSLGVILLEMLCGRLAWAEGCEDHSQSLGPSAKRHHKEKGSLDDMIFEGIMERIEPQSLLIFQNIALRCLEERSNRPYVKDVVKQLEKALEVQLVYLDGINFKLPRSINLRRNEKDIVTSQEGSGKLKIDKGEGFPSDEHYDKRKKNEGKKIEWRGGGRRRVTMVWPGHGRVRLQTRKSFVVFSCRLGIRSSSNDDLGVVFGYRLKLESGSGDGR
ncbi:hypothetical protein E3N88_37858 [Mikania micrantha]|uniref:Protein kinase domain-containing protein n=1 Tax=Mikania micrantha TaxID=192012 RepID=A0A5N6LSE3_9ASTR|nr:hypothetical protein E3N88_37858 [Mikania micrantha]